jgi:competence protein ComFC
LIAVRGTSAGAPGLANTKVSHTLRSLRTVLHGLVDDLLTVLLPGRCPGCGRRAEPVCDRCLAGMRAAPNAASPPGIVWSTAVFAYEGVARELVARVKYRNERIAVRWLGARLAERCAHAPFAIDTVTWVPASAQRRAERGVDHGALLARVVATELGLDARRLLTRDDGPPQTGRPAAERRSGPILREAGAVARMCVAGKNVLVVDDVVTTGATLQAAARVLRSLGAREVLAATVARTPRPGEGRRVPPYTRSPSG